jgi:hypothetical protein
MASILGGVYVAIVFGHAPVQLITNLLAIGCLILGGVLIFKRGGRSNNSYDSRDALSSA